MRGINRVCCAARIGGRARPESLLPVIDFDCVCKGNAGHAFAGGDGFSNGCAPQTCSWMADLGYVG